ncbi:hypothetical protein HHK36_005558 [Tetracentron sinense]|uniref:Gnk2-homologous domain-containing protein n=1 Tax=Tetracentron sinense TaxID=13715 RepID=A0A834ZNI6_TETSI|nr:hypothetical protein HHK36_005558 [Tetracentron sinense]
MSGLSSRDSRTLELSERNLRKVFLWKQGYRRKAAAVGGGVLAIENDALPTYVNQICPNTTNYTANSTYQANLRLLLSFLSSNATVGDGFYNATSGRNPDIVYGLFLCRGDVTDDVCRDCVETASKEILEQCPKGKEAITWYEECMLRYSYQSMFSIMQEVPFIPMFNNTQNISELSRFNQLLAETINGLATRATSGQSRRKFATEEANFTRFQTLYSLVQCTPDISSSDCNRCLRGGIGTLPSCCGGMQGARVLIPSCIVSDALPTYVYHYCPNTTTYTANSTYQANLRLLLSSLSSNATVGNGFYNATSGRNPDMVYGLFLCRGDVTDDVCQDCVETASKDILLLDRCPKEKVATTWYEQCMLRYSNQSIFSIMQEAPAISMYNTQNISEPSRFNQLLADTMAGLASRATSGQSSRNFATEEANFTAFQTLYSLVQCTPDISGSDCNRCLRSGIATLPSCCSGRQGARVLRPSCIVRYELYPFYKIEAPAPAPSVLIPLPSPPPTNRTTTPAPGAWTVDGPPPTPASPSGSTSQRGAVKRKRRVTAKLSTSKAAKIDSPVDNCSADEEYNEQIQGMADLLGATGCIVFANTIASPELNQDTLYAKPIMKATMVIPPDATSRDEEDKESSENLFDYNPDGGPEVSTIGDEVQSVLADLQESVFTEMAMSEKAFQQFLRRSENSILPKTTPQPDSCQEAEDLARAIHLSRMEQSLPVRDFYIGGSSGTKEDLPPPGVVGGIDPPFSASETNMTGEVLEEVLALTATTIVEEVVASPTAESVELQDNISASKKTAAQQDIDGTEATPASRAPEETETPKSISEDSEDNIPISALLKP